MPKPNERVEIAPGSGAAKPKKDDKALIRNVYMRRIVHWWCVSDHDMDVMGSFNALGSAMFAVASFFGTTAIGLPITLYTGDTYTKERERLTWWLVGLSVVGCVVFVVLGIVFAKKKSGHIARIKRDSAQID